MPSDDIPHEAFRIAFQARNLEIDLLWRRSIFFWGFIASAFAAYATSRSAHPLVALAVACFGMVCSFAWTLINRGSKFWYENWEGKIEQNEVLVVGPLFARVADAQTSKGFWLCGRAFSPSKLIIALSDYVFAMWLAIVVGEIMRLLVPAYTWSFIAAAGVAIFVAFSFLFIVVMGCACRRSPNRPDVIPSSGERNA